MNISSEPDDKSSHSEPSAITLDKSSASRAFAWSMVYALISKLVFPLAGLYISRTLGPGPMGAFALLMTIVSFSEVFRDAGLTQTFLASTDMDENKEGSYLTVAIVTGIVPAAILLAASPWFAHFFKLPELGWALPLVSSVVAMNGFSTIPRAKMLKAGQIKMSGGLDVIGSGLGLGIAIAMVAMGFGFVALVVQAIFASVYSLIVSWARYPVKRINANWDAFRQVGKKSGAVLAANGINNLFLFADHTVINKFAGTISNGYFGQATNLAYKPADLFIFPLTRTLMVAFSQAAVDLDRLARVYARSLTVAILVVLPIYAFLGLFSEPIILGLLSHKFVGSIPVLSVMCIYLSFRVLGNISGYALVPAGKHFQTFYPWLATAFLTAIALYFSIIGKGPFPNDQLLMPIVWCFAVGAVFVYSTLLVLGLVHCRPVGVERQKLGKAVIVLLISFAIMMAIRFIPMSIYAQLGIAAILGPVLHMALIGTIFARNPLYYLNRQGPKRLWAEL